MSQTTFVNNPQSFINTYLSAMRNSIISISLGVAIYGFSRIYFKHQKPKDIMKIMSILVYGFSVVTIFVSTSMFRSYLTKLTDEEKQNLPNYIDLKYWKLFEYLGWFLFAIATTMIIVTTNKYHKLFNFF